MSLKAGLKLAALCLILLFLSLALCVALLPFLISADSIRLRMARDLSSMTGYNVQLLSPPSLTVFPSFKATLPHIVLTDNSADNAPIMTAEKIIVRITLLDALRGRARFSETQLIRPHFTLTEPLKTASVLAAFANSEGSFGNALRETHSRLQTHDSEEVTKEQVKYSASPLFLQPFGHIIIEDGLITYPIAAAEPAPVLLSATNAPIQTEKAEKYAPPAKIGQKPQETVKKLPLTQEPLAPVSEEIRDIYAQIDWPQNSDKAALTLTGQWHGASNSLAVQADNALLLMSGGKSGLRISFNSTQGGITFIGTAQAGKNFTAQGNVSARSPGLKQTLNWLGMRLPFDTNITTPFVWESTLKADMQRTELNDIVLTIGDDSGRGTLTLRSEGDYPHISGSLAFEKLTVNLPASAIFAAEQSSPEAQPWMEMPVFNIFGLDLRISADKAAFNGIAIENAAASMQISKTGLFLDIGMMQVFGGTAQSSLQLTSADDRITGLKARFSANKVELDKILQNFADQGIFLPSALKMRGKTNVTLNMQAALPQKQPRNSAAKAEKNNKKSDGRKRISIKQNSVAAKAPKHSEKQQENSPLSYAAVFMKDIWPYAQGQAAATVTNGSLNNFAMPAFMQYLQNKQSFALADIIMPSSAALSFGTLELRCAFHQTSLNPLQALLVFDNHRLELQGEADISRGKLQLQGIFDPVRLDKSGQCGDVQCLRQSLSPRLQFTANSAPAAEFADTQKKQAEKTGVHIMPITAKSAILPH